VISESYREILGQFAPNISGGPVKMGGADQNNISRRSGGGFGRSGLEMFSGTVGFWGCIPLFHMRQEDNAPRN